MRVYRRGDGFLSPDEKLGNGKGGNRRCPRANWSTTGILPLARDRPGYRTYGLNLYGVRPE